MPTLRLPLRDGTLTPYSTGEPRQWERPARPLRRRLAFAATHVVADPLADVSDPLGDGAVDWETTLAFRRHVWSLGLGVAEAMDTAQRGQGLRWPQARTLVELSCAEARAQGGRIVCGAATDQLEDGAVTLAGVTRAYAEQCDVIESLAGQAILMASPHLARTARGPADYVEVYDEILRGRSSPVMLHWLGAPFVPAFATYWGSADLHVASETLLEIIGRNADRVEGVKVSVLDKSFEIDLRRRLPPGVRLLTGDDFHFVELIRGDEEGYSDALLGAFDPLAPAAAAALAALDESDVEAYEEVLAPTVPLARTIFEAPTGNYKTGVVFMAYLNGHQDHFRMLGGMEAARSLVHLADVFRAADAAGLLVDPELATARMRHVLALGGVDGDPL